MINLYIKEIDNLISYYKSLGVSNKNIILKIQRKYAEKRIYRQTRNCNQIISFVCDNRELFINEKLLQFYKE
mgnify:CR=1 FL=1